MTSTSFASTSSTSDTPLFLVAIRESLSNWTSFQLAIKHGMGGNEANEKQLWLSQVLMQIFHDNKDLSPDEVADVVAEVINNEFDTIIEDGSLDILAHSLCNYYKLCRDGHEDQVNKKLEKLRSSHAQITHNNVCSDDSLQQIESLHIHDNNESKESDGRGNDTPMDQSDVDEGWTLVHRKNKR